MWIIALGLGIVGYNVIAHRHFLGDLKELVKDGLDMNRARVALKNSKLDMIKNVQERFNFAEKTGEVMLDIRHIVEDARNKKY